MSNITSEEISSNLDRSEQQRALEHEIVRSIVEGEQFTVPKEAQPAVIKLRELCRSKEKGERVDPVLIAFATTLITTGISAFIQGLKELLAPPTGFAVVYNPGPPIKVWTYDETDGVRWIAYREYSIGTNEAVPLTARGNNAVQVVVIGKPQVHTCAKGQSYSYQGNTMQPRTGP